VLTLENYQQTMYMIVRASGYASSLWFIAWVLIGEPVRHASMDSKVLARPTVLVDEQGAASVHKMMHRSGTVTSLPTTHELRCFTSAPSGRYLFLSLFLTVVLDVFDSKYERVVQRRASMVRGLCAKADCNAMCQAK
jgi:hypothetical protein